MFAYCLNNPIIYLDSAGTLCKPNESQKIRILMCEYGMGGGAVVLLPIGIIAASLRLINSLAYWMVEAGSEMLSLIAPPLSATDRIAKADAEIKKTVKTKSKVRYWTATVHSDYVDIGRPLTFNQAVKEVVAGRSVFAVTWFEAKAVAIAAGGQTGHNNKSLQPEIDRGKENTPGFYWHYHTYDRSGGHVYYLFGEVS